MSAPRIAAACFAVGIVALVWLLATDPTPARPAVPEPKATQAVDLEERLAPPEAPAEPQAAPQVAADPPEARTAIHGSLEGRIRAVVVDARGEEVSGLPGVEITLRRGARRVHECVTGPDGHYQLDVETLAELDRSVRLRAAAPPGFAPEASTTRYPDGWPAAEVRLEFSRSAPLRGKVIDGSGEPLAQYPLWISGGGGRRESTTTDEDGSFEGRLDRRAGPVEVQLLGDRRGWPPESPRLERQHEVTEEGAVELILEANPAGVLTVQLRTAPNEALPDELDDVRCTLLAIDESWPQADRAFLGTNYVGQPERVPDDERVLYRVWMNDLFDLESRPGPWLVRVEPIDGGWVAEGTFDAGDLEEGQPVTAKLRRTGAVALTLLDGNGSPVQSEPVRLLADAAGEPRQPFTTGMYRRPRETNAAGGEVWLGLDPGTYTLEVEGIHFEPAQRTLEVVAGETTECTVTLETRAGGGSLVVRVQTESGARRHAMFWLYSRDDPKDPVTSQGALWRQEGDRRVGEAHFDGLEPGEYKLRLVSTSGIPGEPLSMLTQVEADATTTVDFHFKDGSTAPLAVVARDGGSGRVLDDWRLLLGDGQWFLDSDLREVEGADGRKMVARHVPTTSTAPGSVAWLIADGFAAQSIDLSEGTVIDSEGTRLHVVDLDSGWGKLLVVKDPDEMPLEGVGVYLDGSLAGHTGSMGRLLLSGPAKPDRMRFEVDGYQVRSNVVRNSDDLYLGSSQVAIFGSALPL